MQNHHHTIEDLDATFPAAVNFDALGTAPGDQHVFPQVPQTRHILIFQAGQGEHVVALDGTTHSVGRHHANAIVLKDETISQYHALLMRTFEPEVGTFFQIIDGTLYGKRSRNGLWINGERIYSKTLKDGDVITFSTKARATYRQLITQVVTSEQTDVSLAMALNAGAGAAIGNGGGDSQQLAEQALRRVSSIPEMSPYPIVEMDLRGTITYLNPRAIEHFSALNDDPEHPVRSGLIETMLRGNQTELTREVRVAGVWYAQMAHFIPQYRVVRSYLIDITKHKHLEVTLRQSEERYAAAARGANDGLWDWDLRQDTLYLSHHWKQMIGYAEHELSNHKREWFDRLHSEDRARVKNELERHLLGEQDHFECEYRLLHKNGTYRWFRCRGMSLLDEQDKPYRVAGTQTDITEYNLAREQLLHDAFYDAMTGLPNRVMLMDRMTQAIKRCKRHDGKSCAVLFLDLDRFKMINDSLGHMLGDKLLVEVAARLGNCTREEDTVARLGGDEFVVLVEDVEGLGAAIATAQRIQMVLKESINLNGQQVHTSASIGIAMGNSSYERAEELLRDADTAMYEAKQMGKDRYSVFKRNMHSQAVDLLRLENDLRRAIDRREFQLHYQPIIDLSTNQICSFEALVRWQHPERGLVPPSEFIPLAEDTGLIVPLGNLLLYEASKQLQQWQHQFETYAQLSVCVNIASRQFDQANFVAKLRRVLDEVAIAPGTLKLEITEGVIMKNPTEIAEKLHHLKQLGLKLSIDDFGTGYSSLSYLQTFPVDTLKIDRSFVIRMGHPDSREIVKTIITLAHTLKLDVVAEGVETEIQAQLLKAMDCEFVQGYYFSRPVNAHDATQLLMEAAQSP